jgi:hypothetical protein
MANDRSVADAIWRAVDAVEAAKQAVARVQDRDMAASADQALRAASFDLAEALRRLGWHERRSVAR